MAIETAIPMQGHPGVRHLGSTGLFLMKCAAYHDRGQQRPEDSKDLADLAVLLVGSDIPADAAARPSHVRSEVRSRARWLRARPSLAMSMLSHFAERRPRPPDTTEDLADEAIAVLERLGLLPD